MLLNVVLGLMLKICVLVHEPAVAVHSIANSYPIVSSTHHSDTTAQQIYLMVVLTVPVLVIPHLTGRLAVWI